MRVVNPLSGPVASTSIPVLVFVRAADNIEYAAPRSTPATTVTNYALQSAEVQYHVKPKQIVAGNAPTSGDPNKYLVHYGERIASFRPLIHRYARQYSTQANPAANISTTICTHRTSRRLKYNGYVSDAYWVANKLLVGGTAQYNYIRTNIAQLVSLMFIGQRGSINHQFCVDTCTYSLPAYVAQLTLQQYDKAIVPSTDWTALVSVNTTTQSQGAYRMYSQLEPNTGTALTDQRTQAGISMNFPYYSQYNFQFVNPAYANAGSSVDGTDKDNIQLEFTFPKSTAGGTTYIHAWSGLGPDYNFFFFINCPSLYFTALPTA